MATNADEFVEYRDYSPLMFYKLANCYIKKGNLMLQRLLNQTVKDKELVQPVVNEVIEVYQSALFYYYRMAFLSYLNEPLRLRERISALRKQIYYFKTHLVQIGEEGKKK